MVLVSNFKILRIIQQAPNKSISNIDISKEILEENIEDYNLGSVKVMVSRKTKQLIEQGDIKRVGRKFTTTNKGLANLSAQSFARTSYDITSRIFSNIQVSFATLPNRDGKIIYEDREIEEALKKLDKALKNERNFSLIIKMKENQE